MPQPQRGYSLVELSIGLAIGMLLVAGISGHLVSTSAAFVRAQGLAQLQDEARTALGILRRAIERAGHYGAISEPGRILIHAGLSPDDDCGRPGERWATALSRGALHSIDNIASSAAARRRHRCLGAGLVRPGTDLLAIRQAGATTASVLEPGALYLRSDGVRGVLYRHLPGQAPPFRPSGPVQTRRYSPAIYYVQRHSFVRGDGIPALCREVLHRDGFRRQCLAFGIADLQLQFGIDTDPVPDRQADHYSATLQPGDRAVSVRVHLLAQSLRPQRRQRDPRRYRLDNSTATPAGPLNDGHDRRLLTTTVVLRNPVGPAAGTR